MSEIYRKLVDYQEDYIDFSSNDYLGLSKNIDVINAGIKAAISFGSGSTGSRLLSGNKKIFKEFEDIISRDKNTEASLIFNSGFQANSGVLECISDKNTTVIFDKLNHSSMYFGVFSSGAKLSRFNHLDYDQLESILKNENSKNIIIASDTVFGMDGDIANLKILSDLSNKYNALLYLDEAHATGLYGKNGYGISTDYDLNQEKTLIMGTFSKAIGSSGAYVACSNIIKNYLIQKCKSFIYSTALSPFCIGSAMLSWNLIRSLDEIRNKLSETTDKLRKQFIDLGFNIKGNGTNIIPIVCESNEVMLKIKEKCLKNGIIVSGITNPTSPTPRTRIAIRADHSISDIDSLIEVIKK